MNRAGVSYVVDSHRHECGDMFFDVAIFQLGAEYYAAWYCRRCLTRTETGRCATAKSAQRSAHEAIDDHLREKHRAGR